MQFQQYPTHNHYDHSNCDQNNYGYGNHGYNHNECSNYGGYGGEQGYNPHAWQTLEVQKLAQQFFSPQIQQAFQRTFPPQYQPECHQEPQRYRPQYPGPMPVYRQQPYAHPVPPPKAQPRDAQLVFFPPVEGVPQSAEEPDRGYTRVYSILVRENKLVLIARADIHPDEYLPDKSGKATDPNELVKTTARRCTDGLNPKHRLGKACVKEVHFVPTPQRAGTQVFAAIVDVTTALFTKATPCHTLAMFEESLNQAGPEGELVWGLLNKLANVAAMDREQPLRISAQEPQQQAAPHVHMPAAVFQNHAHSNSSFRP